jgi:tetratricopeptide (TPR) repeat protein
VELNVQPFQTTYSAEAAMRRSILAALFFALLPLWTQAQANKRVNLTRLPASKVEGAATDFAALFDDNPSTLFTAEATAANPCEVVIGFGGAVYTPERLVVKLPAAAKDQPAARVEIRVSTDSPDAGYQFLRADVLKPTADSQEFSLPPAPAKWVMLRFSPAPNVRRISIADVAILGREGPPASQYAFKESPVRALDVLSKLKKISRLQLEVSTDETALFADVKDGKFQKWTFADAALMASGVTNPAKRKTYATRLDWMTESAKKAIAGGKSPETKADLLLRWLHGGTMAKGYKLNQTDLHTILESGTFNCVSSAVLYNVIGRRLGLDLRAVEVPDHAFSILYHGGKSADVETTTPVGFNPARDKAAQAQLEATTGFRYIPDSHRDQRREVGEAGLVAIIHYNHGVEHSKAKRHHEALLSYFRAMSLDPEFASAVKNALGELATWSVELARAGKFDEALLVCGAGLELAPQDYILVTNRKAIWIEWADSLMRAGKDDEAIALLRKAADATPSDAEYFKHQQAGLYIRIGEERIKARQWEEAMAAADPGLQKVDASAQTELKQWQTGVRPRWARSEVDLARYAAALDIIAAGLKKSPDDKRLNEFVAFAIQRWMGEVAAKEGEQAAVQLLLAQARRFPAAESLGDVAISHVAKTLRGLRDAGKFDEALAVLDRNQTLLQKLCPKKASDQSKDMATAIYDSWAKRHIAAKEWSAAADIYAKALERFPRDYHLSNNLVYVVQEWVKDATAQDGSDAARRILGAQVQRFPDIRGVKDLALSHLKRETKKCKDEGKFEDALALLTRHQEHMADPKDARHLRHGVYDSWADSLMKKNPKDWSGATSVYDRALKESPDDSSLQSSAIRIWGQWAQAQSDAKDWAGAIKTYEEALRRFPKSISLQNSLAHCKRQVARNE